MPKCGKQMTKNVSENFKQTPIFAGEKQQEAFRAAALVSACWIL
jgi:hypothetical protein